jgi:hypothetical protein
MSCASWPSAAGRPELKLEPRILSFEFRNFNQVAAEPRVGIPNCNSLILITNDITEPHRMLSIVQVSLEVLLLSFSLDAWPNSMLLAFDSNIRPKT